MALTAKQRRFIDEYLKCWNASEAARRAGYSERTAYSTGSENLRKPEIAAEIEARLKANQLSADEVLSELADIAKGVGETFIDIRHGLPFMDWDALKAAGKLNLIKKFKYDNDGHPEVEFYDRQRALEQLGRHHQLFTDKVDVTTAGKPIKTYVGVSPDDWDDDGSNSST